MARCRNKETHIILESGESESQKTHHRVTKCMRSMEIQNTNVTKCMTSMEIQNTNVTKGTTSMEIQNTNVTNCMTSMEIQNTNADEHGYTKHKRNQKYPTISNTNQHTLQRRQQQLPARCVSTSQWISAVITAHSSSR